MYNGLEFTRVQAAAGGTVLGADGTGQQFVYIKALKANTAVVGIGEAGDAADAFELSAGEQLGPLPHARLADLFVYGAAGNFVCILTITT